MRRGFTSNFHWKNGLFDVQNLGEFSSDGYNVRTGARRSLAEFLWIQEMVPIGPVVLYSQRGSIYMNFWSKEARAKRSNVAQDMAQVEKWRRK